MDNKAYFSYSQKNDDIIIDYSKQEGYLVINKNSSEPETYLMAANHNLTELITAYKVLKSDDKFNSDSLNTIVDKIIRIIETTNLINYSSFCVYLQVIGYSYSKYIEEKKFLDIEDKRELMKQLLDLYISNRHDIYLYHGYSDQILQVQSDAASSRRNGKTGIDKMEEIMKPLGFVKADKALDLEFRQYCYLLPDKGGKKVFDSFLKNKKIRFDFRETKDGKNPDLFFKVNNDYYILEHKLTNGGGGSQNAEINEIIQFVNYEEDNNNWHYISCLQGDYFKRLNANNNEPKAAKQYNNIMTALDNHPKNYFVNGKGFEKLIKDLTKKH